MTPAQIDDVRCKKSKSNSVTLEWEAPWNGAFVTSYSVWHHQAFSSYIVKSDIEGGRAPTMYTVKDIAPKTAHEFWVRIDQPSFVGSYSQKVTCPTS